MITNCDMKDFYGFSCWTQSFHMRMAFSSQPARNKYLSPITAGK